MERKDITHFSGKGTVYSYTTINNPDYAPSGFQNQVPYTVALVKLEEGPIITAQLTDLDHVYAPNINKGEIRLTKVFPELCIGLPVEMVTRRLMEDGDERGLIVYGYKFRPVLQKDC